MYRSQTYALMGGERNRFPRSVPDLRACPLRSEKVREERLQNIRIQLKSVNGVIVATTGIVYIFCLISILLKIHT